jgi:hypothetical protein
MVPKRAWPWLAAAVTAACGGKAVIDGSSGNGGGGAGGAGGATSNTTTTTSIVGPGPATSGVGAAGPCAVAPDTCHQCASNNCGSELMSCIVETTCDGSGKPVAGCLALVDCALANCPGGDLGCIAMVCGDELGSCSGSCTGAAQDLGNCMQQNCGMACF